MTVGTISQNTQENEASVVSGITNVDSINIPLLVLLISNILDIWHPIFKVGDVNEK